MDSLSTCCSVFAELEKNLFILLGLKGRAPSITDLGEIEYGDRVIVAGQRKGTVKYVGESKFAPG